MKSTIYALIVGLMAVVMIGMYCERQSKPSERPLSRLTTQIWRITAYCPCTVCCGRFSDGITASGAKARGKLIAAPKEIPFGKWIEIEGYGYAEVLDRGGAIKDRRLDVLFPTHQEALNWGVQYIEVKL